MNLMKAMATVAGMTGLSRIAGFVRDILTAAYLGAGPVGDAFFVALKLPNFFRRVTAEGAFSIAFVPIYSRKMEQNSSEDADLFASNAFMVMLSILSVVTLIIMMMMPYVIKLIAPGFADDPMRVSLSIELARITFPYLLLMSLTALLGGVLNALNRFAPFAFAPVLFNVSLITFLLLSDHFETTGHALSCGVLVAGFLQLFFLWCCAKRAGVKIVFAFPKMDIDIRKLLKVMGPAVLGAGVVHINLFADLILASFLETGAISYLYYADRLNQLPLGVVGIAVGTALLPMLSRAMTRDDTQHAMDLFNRALEACLLLALPAAIALAVIPLSLVSVLFERGAFDATDSQMTANVLMAYALGLPAYIAIKVFSTAHWARGDTKTPVRISIISTLINIVMSVILIQYIGVVGIALATGLTGWLQFYLHVTALRDHPSAKFDNRFLVNMPKIILSSCLMGFGVYILAALLQNFIFDASLLFQIIGLATVIIMGSVIYGASIILTGVVKPQDIKKLILKKGQKT